MVRFVANQSLKTGMLGGNGVRSQLSSEFRSTGSAPHVAPYRVSAVSGRSSGAKSLAEQCSALPKALLTSRPTGVSGQRSIECRVRSSECQIARRSGRAVSRLQRLRWLLPWFPGRRSRGLLCPGLSCVALSARGPPDRDVAGCCPPVVANVAP